MYTTKQQQLLKTNNNDKMSAKANSRPTTTTTTKPILKRMSSSWSSLNVDSFTTKNVSFVNDDDEMNEIVMTMSIKDYTQGEIERSWFSKQERQMILSRTAKTVQRMNQGKEPREGYTYRGLERYSDKKQNKEKKINKKNNKEQHERYVSSLTNLEKSKSIVLDCFDGEAFYWIENEEMLATLYSKFTKKSKLIALSTGLQDEVDAKAAYSDMEMEERQQQIPTEQQQQQNRNTNSPKKRNSKRRRKDDKKHIISIVVDENDTNNDLTIPAMESYIPRSHDPSSSSSCSGKATNPSSDTNTDVEKKYYKTKFLEKAGRTNGWGYRYPLTIFLGTKSSSHHSSSSSSSFSQQL